VKILVAGPYRDGTGYSKALREYIMALITAGADVVCRPIKMSNGSTDIEPIIVASENKNLNNVDVFFQCNLPHTFERKEGILNVGSFFWETSHFRHSNWARKMDLIDIIIVPTSSNVTACEQSGVESSKINKINVPCDISKYNKDYGKIDSDLFKNKFIFYTIGEFRKRKNFEDLLKAYYTFFTSRDNVLLVIKSSASGSDEQQLNAISSFVDTVRKSCTSGPKYLFPKVVVIPGTIPEEKINRIHNSCDVFVTASKGEGWCLPAFDAMAFGNHVIAPDHTAFREYDCVKVPSVMVNVDENTKGISDLYCGDEYWYQCDVNYLGCLMKKMYGDYEDGTLTHRSREQINNYLNTYSYATIGDKLIKLFEGKINGTI